MRPVKVMATVTACLIAAACTGGTSGSSGDDGDATSINWLIEEPEDAAAIQALEEHISGFEEESGIDVQLDTMPLDAMRTVLQNQLRSGDGPDVFNWGSGPGFGGALAEAGLLYDLTDAYEEYGWEVFDFARERVTFNDQTYGVPGELETIGVFYNEDVFTELGLEQPETIDDLQAAAQTIRDAGMVPMTVGDQDGWPGGHLLSMTLSSDIGSDGIQALIDGEQPWDSPEVVSALSLWSDFNESGYLGESPTSINFDISAAQFYSGEAAMIPTGSWLVGEIDDNVDFGVGYIPFPGPDGPGIFTGGLGSGPYISAGTTKTEAALEFVDFLASPEHGAWTVENLHTIPPMPLETSELDVSPLFAEVLEITADVSTSGDFGHNIDVLVTDAFNEAMYDGVQAILSDQRTPEEVAADLEAAAQE